MLGCDDLSKIDCDAEEFVYVGTNRNEQPIVVKKRKKFAPCKSTSKFYTSSKIYLLLFTLCPKKIKISHFLEPLHSPDEGNDTRTCEQTHSIVPNLSKDPPIPTNSGMQRSHKNGSKN